MTFHSDREILAACRKVLDDNGLSDWRVKTVDRQGFWASALIGKKLIEVSRLTTWIEQGFSSDKIMDVIKHEVAHALVHCPNRRSWPAKQLKTKDGLLRFRRRPGWQDRDHHCLAWARAAVKLGCKPELGATEWQRKVLQRAAKESGQ